MDTVKLNISQLQQLFNGKRVLIWEKDHPVYPEKLYIQVAPGITPKIIKFALEECRPRD